MSSELPAPARPRWRRARAIAAVFALLLLSLHFALSLQQHGKTFLDTAAYVRLDERRPYQYRLLMAPLLGGLIDAYRQPRVRAHLQTLPPYVSTPEAAAYLTLNTLAFLASCLLVLAIAGHALGAATAAARMAFVAYVSLAYLFFCLVPNGAFILPYDVPALALAQACLLAVLTRRWRWLYPLFVLATLNRETSLLVVVFLLSRQLLRPTAAGPAAWRHAMALGLMWVAIKAGLYLAFSAQPSDEGLRLTYNLHVLLHPWQWPALLPLVGAFGLTLQGLRGGVAQREWALTGALGFLLIAPVGQLLETRAFGDLIVFFALAIAQVLQKTDAVRSAP